MADQRTQSFAPIEEIRDGILVLRDGSMRAIIMASSINFALKSADEQEAILKQFQSFLNTLDFSLQIYIQSRELDINPYLELLGSREKSQTNDLMRIQLREYMMYIKKFTQDVDVMTKTFFVVVPYNPAKIDVSKGIKSLLGLGSSSPHTADTTFAEHKTQLGQRVAVVEQGLARVGIRTILLGTNEVIDLFYHIFNPYEGKKALAAKT